MLFDIIVSSFEAIWAIRAPPHSYHRYIHHQSSRQRHDNLFAVRGALAAQHLTVDAPADAPIGEGKPYVDGNGSLPAGLLDQGTDLDQQFVGFLALQIQISLPHPYPFTMFTRLRLPMDIGSLLPMGLEGGDRSLRWG